MLKGVFFFAASLSFVQCSVASAAGQDRDQYSALREKLQTLRDRVRKIQSYQIADLADASLGMPVGAYNGKGQLILSANYQSRTRFTTKRDGSMAATVLVGKPDKLVGEFTLINNDMSRIGSRGTISARVGHSFGGTYVSLGFDQLYTWGGTDAFRGTSLRVSRSFELSKNSNKAFSRLYVSVGIGNGRYAPEGFLNRKNAQGVLDPDLNHWGGVCTFGVNLSDRALAFANYSGNDWIVGLSLRPFPKSGFFITPAFSDVSRQAGDGPRFVVSAGFMIPLGK